MLHRLTFLFLTLLASVSSAADTQILKWKDGKKAVYLLAFDDGCPSHLLTVIPELEKRKLVGTFYLVTGNSLYGSLKSKWERIAKSPSVVFANHTFTHKGASTADELDQELAKCNEVLHRFFPDRPQPRLLAFGQPGGVPWKVTKEELAAALAKHHLVNRPPFHGSPMHYKSAAEMIATIDAALAKGEMGHMDFHGVETDWLVTPLDWFVPFLDKLVEKQDELWVTDMVSWHQYQTERETAAVKVLAETSHEIRLELTSAADPKLYNHPLTLSTKVPAAWKAAKVAQGTANAEVPVKDGAVQYSAVPGGGEIVLRPGAN
jgi:peptidoglycan/xylan/chitin deacetylase (PgdA/CDA1 family)